MSVMPSAEQINHLIAHGPAGEIYMLNLLRFNAQAQYPADADFESCTGEQAFTRYKAAVEPLLKKAGGTLQAMLDCHSSVIGESGDEFDEMLLVQYPSKEAFLGMISSDEYQAIVVHRMAAVEHSLLIPTTAAM